MKFRALQWDYHAEAVLVESEKERRRNQSRRDAKETTKDPLQGSAGAIAAAHNDEKVSALPPTDKARVSATMALPAMNEEVRAFQNQSSSDLFFKLCMRAPTYSNTFLWMPFDSPAI